MHTNLVLAALATLVSALGLFGCGGETEDGGGNTGGSSSGGSSTGGSSTGGSSTGGSSTGGSSTGGAGGSSQSLPLGDCDPETPCADAASCTPTSLPQLSVCPSLPTYYDTPACGPTPHPDGVGEIIPTCCTAADCTEGSGTGHCVYSEQTTGCCGTQGTTYCVYDSCQVDGDCPSDQICVPAGTRELEANTCVPAPCVGDGDCSESPGGQCRLLGRGSFAALVCAYPNSPCLQDSDCTSGPCGSDWCSPRWTSTGQGWELADGVECHEDTSCQTPP